MTRNKGKLELKRCNNLPPPPGGEPSEIQSYSSELQSEKPSTATGVSSKDELDEEFTSLVNQFVSASDLVAASDMDELLSTLENDWKTTPLAQISSNSSISKDLPEEIVNNTPSYDLHASPQPPNTSEKQRKRLFSEIPSGQPQETWKGRTDSLNYERESRTQDGVRRLKMTSLRSISQTVSEKVQQKRQTTYDEIAEEVVTEHEHMEEGHPSSNSAGGKLSDAVVKNIKRRVYDCLNVLCEIKLISKNPATRRITWIDQETAPEELSRTFNLSTLEERKSNLQNSLKKKASILLKYEEEVAGLQNLIKRNQRDFHAVGHLPEANLTLPFTLLEILDADHAMVCKLSDDKEIFQIESNSKFIVHDGACVARSLNKIQK